MAVNRKIEIEKIVKQHMEADGRTVKWFCEKMNWDRKKWYRFQINGLIDVHDLQKVSGFFDYDFFQCFSRKDDMKQVKK